MTLLRMPIVNSECSDHRSAFLYAASMRCGFKVTTFNLLHKQSPVAFTFVDKLQGGEGPVRGHAVPTGHA